MLLGAAGVSFLPLLRVLGRPPLSDQLSPKSLLPPECESFLLETKASPGF